jgi:hypothetical protein
MTILRRVDAGPEADPPCYIAKQYRQRQVLP